jgi:hypothetical protein
LLYVGAVIVTTATLQYPTASKSSKTYEQIIYIRSQHTPLFKHVQHTSKQNMNIFPRLIDDDEYDLLGKQMFCYQQQLEKFLVLLWFCQE